MSESSLYGLDPTSLPGLDGSYPACQHMDLPHPPAGPSLLHVDSSRVTGESGSQAAEFDRVTVVSEVPKPSSVISQAHLQSLQTSQVVKPGSQPLLQPPLLPQPPLPPPLPKRLLLLSPCQEPMSKGQCDGAGSCVSAAQTCEPGEVMGCVLSVWPAAVEAKRRSAHPTWQRLGPSRQEAPVIGTARCRAISGSRVADPVALLR